MFGLGRLKYIFLFLVASIFSKAGSIRPIKDVGVFNAIKSSSSLHTFENDKTLKWAWQFKKNGLFLKKRGKKVRGLAGSVPCVAKNWAIKIIEYSSFEPRYLNLYFLSFRSHCSFDRGPPTV